MLRWVGKKILIEQGKQQAEWNFLARVGWNINFWNEIMWGIKEGLILFKKGNWQMSGEMKIEIS